MPKIGFAPISIEAFVTEFMKNNPGENPASVTANLKGALGAYKRGVTCSCGAPLWVIGSAVSGNACFTCITGEAVPDSDYEIDAGGRQAATWRPGWKLAGLLPGEPPRRWDHSLAVQSLPPGTYRLLVGAPNPMPGGRPLRFANRAQDRDLPGWLTVAEFDR